MLYCYETNGVYGHRNMTSIRARCTTLCDKICQSLATGRWFSRDPPVFSTNKTDNHDLTEILLNLALSTIKHTNKPTIQGTSYSNERLWPLGTVKSNTQLAFMTFNK